MAIRCSDLQSNKVDLAFALNPTPQRALAIGFCHAAIVHPIGAVVRKGLDPATWDDINKPDVRIVYDIGSLHEVVAKRYCPKAQLTGFKSRDDCTLAMSSGRADVHILAAILGLAALGKIRSLAHITYWPIHWWRCRAASRCSASRTRGSWT